MTLKGGKVNKSLKAWVNFVKKVAKEEKIKYSDAIHRAKVRKDKGEKWMFGGDPPTNNEKTANVENKSTRDATTINTDTTNNTIRDTSLEDDDSESEAATPSANPVGGKKHKTHRKTHRKAKKSHKRKTMRKKHSRKH